MTDKSSDPTQAANDALAPFATQLAQYVNMKLRSLSPTKTYKVRELLNKGEDPLLVAIYFRAPFAQVAKLANAILAERGHAVGKELGVIPETLPEYMQLVMKIAAATDKLERGEEILPEPKAKLLPTKPIDSRPRKGAWAPGGYLCKCANCGSPFLGDKRSHSCADCAYLPTVE